MRDTQGKRTPVWYALIVLFVSVISVAVSSILYTSHTARESERKWCGIILTLDGSFSTRAPSTPYGKQLAENIHQLAQEFDCHEKGGKANGR